MKKRFLLLSALAILLTNVIAQNPNSNDGDNFIEDPQEMSIGLRGGLGFGITNGGIGGVQLSGLFNQNIEAFVAVGYGYIKGAYTLGMSLYLGTKSYTVKPKVVVMYGTNRYLIGQDKYANQFDGFSGGFNLEIRLKKEYKSYLSIGAYYCHASEEYRSKLDELSKIPGISIQKSRFPFTFSISYHFHLLNF
ncbi:MAG: hypothetical protein JXR60_03555 [Bacteroidales bacterium]|nr:hypothetical protein [Bacteroidales bacterium]